MRNVNLILDSARGQFIPRDFVQGFKVSKFSGISPEDVQELQNPENENYWETWESVLNNASYLHDDGRLFTLHHDGDLFLICVESMTSQEKENFGFDN